MSAQEAEKYSIIVTTSRDGESAAKDGRLKLSTTGGKLEPRPEPEREGPTTSP